MRLTITAEDIDAGLKFSVTDCPVALAACRKFGPMWHVIVGIERLSITGYIEQANGSVDCIKRHYTLPKVLRQFIRDFDSGLPVTPGEFIIRYHSSI